MWALSMRATFTILVVLFLGTVADSNATTLPPELKAYDFAEAYSLEKNSVVISPYHHGFYCSSGVQTSRDIRIVPGDTFLQYDPARMVVEDYCFVRFDAAERRAFFHERSFHYKVVKDAHGKSRYVRQELIDTDDFYLTGFRALEPFDRVFTNIELHPGSQDWKVNKN